MACSSIQRRVEVKDGLTIIVCGRLSAAAGFRISVPEPQCELCRDDPESKAFQATLQGALRARLIAGDLPRYQAPNPVDLQAAFAQFRRMAGDAASRDLLHAMFRVQAQIAETDGGHPPEVLAERLAALAEAHHMLDVLEEAIYEFARAKPGGPGSVPANGVSDAHAR